MTKKATYSCPGLVLVWWTLNPIWEHKAGPIRNYATWIRPTYTHPKGPIQSISTTVTTEDRLHFKEKSVFMQIFYFFFPVLPKTHITVIERICPEAIKKQSHMSLKPISPVPMRNREKVGKTG